MSVHISAFEFIYKKNQGVSMSAKNIFFGWLPPPLPLDTVPWWFEEEPEELGDGQRGGVQGDAPGEHGGDQRGRVQGNAPGEGP